MNTHKLCANCKTIKLVINFHRHSKFKGWCKVCAKRQAAINQAIAEKRKEPFIETWDRLKKDLKFKHATWAMIKRGDYSK